MKSGAVAAVAAVLLYYGVDLLFKRTESTVPRSPKVEALYSQEVTPNDRFYRVDSNIIDPEIKQADWRLVVDGLVERPLSLSFGDLGAMPQVEQYNPLQCVSNSVGGIYISNAKWKGVRLKDVLARAGVKF